MRQPPRIRLIVQRHVDPWGTVRHRPVIRLGWRPCYVGPDFPVPSQARAYGQQQLDRLKREARTARTQPPRR